MASNRIAIFEGYSVAPFNGYKRRRKSGGAKRSGGRSAWNRKFGACGRKCGKANKPGSKAAGSCMRSCLKKKG